MLYQVVELTSATDITTNNELRDIVFYNLRYIKHIVTHQRVCSSSDKAWYGQIYIQQGVPILLWC